MNTDSEEYKCFVFNPRSSAFIGGHQSQGVLPLRPPNSRQCSVAEWKACNRGSRWEEAFMQVASTLVFTARLAPRYGRYSKKSTKRGGMIVHRGLGILQYDRHWRDVAARTAQAQPRSPTDVRRIEALDAFSGSHRERAIRQASGRCFHQKLRPAVCASAGPRRARDCRGGRAPG